MSEKNTRLEDLGEDKIIELLLYKMHKYYPRKSRLPIGDDAAEIEDTGIVVSIDGYSLAFSKYEWEDWSDWGWRAVISSISDLIAKGARPLGIMVSIGLEKNTSQVVLEKIYEGIRQAIETYNLYLLGGDTNASMEKAWITVASIGKAVAPPIPRDGAKKGDYVYTTLKNGGYGISGLIWEIYKKYNASPRDSVGIDIKLRPEVPIEFLQLVKKIPINASIDVSDGLSKSLHLLSIASNVKITVTDIPSFPSRELVVLAEKEKIDVRECVLFGGEDYEVVFTSPANPQFVEEECKKTGIRCMNIGKITDEGKGVFWASGKRIDYGGYDQFRGY